jgi:urease accessory protein
MRPTLVPSLFAIVVLAVSHPASAHHVMDGKLPGSFIQGLLSGLGHPIIGIDHLAFLAAIGVAVGVARLHLATPLAFVGASAIGVALHLQGITIPAAEAIIAASVLLVGGLIAGGGIVRASTWLVLFGLAGLIHGYAYGESIVGAEPAPLLAYFSGLMIIQTLLSAGIALATRQLADPVAPRLAGAVVAGIGLAVLAARVLPA